MSDYVTNVNGKITVAGEKVPQNRDDYTQIGNTLVLSELLANFSNNIFSSFGQGTITLTDGTKISVNTKDWTQKGKGNSVITKNSDGATVFANFNQQHTRITGTEGKDRYRVIDSSWISIDPESGNDEIFVGDSQNITVYLNQTGDETDRVVSDGSSVEVNHRENGESKTNSQIDGGKFSAYY